MKRFQHNHKPDAIITAARIGPTTAWVRTFRERKRLARQIADCLANDAAEWVTDNRLAAINLGNCVITMITDNRLTEIHFDSCVIAIRDFETTPTQGISQ